MSAIQVAFITPKDANSENLRKSAASIWSIHFCLAALNSLLPPFNSIWLSKIFLRLGWSLVLSPFKKKTWYLFTRIKQHFLQYSVLDLKYFRDFVSFQEAIINIWSVNYINIGALRLRVALDYKDCSTWFS